MDQKKRFYLIKTKNPTTNKIIITQTKGLISIHIKIDIINMNKSNIKTPAKIKIKTPIIAIMKIPTAEPNISAMA